MHADRHTRTGVDSLSWIPEVGMAWHPDDVHHLVCKMPSMGDTEKGNTEQLRTGVDSLS